MPESRPVGRFGDSRRVYQIEVCAICGGHLNNRYNRAGSDGSAPNGRCGVSESHWGAGGVLVDVTPLPFSQQRERRRSQERLVKAGVIPDA